MLRSLILLFVKIAIGLLLTGLVMPAELAMLPPWARTPATVWITLIVCVGLVVFLGPSGDWGRKRGSKPKPDGAPAPPKA